MPSPWMHLCKWRKAVCRTARTSSSRMLFITKRRSPFWKSVLRIQLPCPCETQGDSHHSHCPFCPSDTGLHSSSTASTLGLHSAPQRLLPTASLFWFTLGWHPYHQRRHRFGPEAWKRAAGLCVPAPQSCQRAHNGSRRMVKAGLSGQQGAESIWLCFGWKWRQPPSPSANQSWVLCQGDWPQVAPWPR